LPNALLHCQTHTLTRKRTTVLSHALSYTAWYRRPTTVVRLLPVSFLRRLAAISHHILDPLTAVSGHSHNGSCLYLHCLVTQTRGKNASVLPDRCLTMTVSLAPHLLLLQLPIQYAPRCTTKRPSSEPNGATRQQAIVKTLA
jgi:hypothetical protein